MEQESLLSAKDGRKDGEDHSKAQKETPAGDALDDDVHRTAGAATGHGIANEHREGAKSR